MKDLNEYWRASKCFKIFGTYVRESRSLKPIFEIKTSSISFLFWSWCWDNQPRYKGRYLKQQKKV